MFDEEYYNNLAEADALIGYLHSEIANMKHGTTLNLWVWRYVRFAARLCRKLGYATYWDKMPVNDSTMLDILRFASKWVANPPI